MTHNDSKVKYIRYAAIIALLGNAVLAALKIVTGLLSNSEAMLGDGIDSSSDVIISIVTLVVIKIISKPADSDHPWGHGRAETITTVILSFIIFFAGAQLIIAAVSSLISGEEQLEQATIAIVVTLVSIGGKMLLAWSQYAFGKRADSAMIKANAKNMMSDILISAGVLAGLVISSLTGLAYPDRIIAILIGIWIIKTAIGIFIESNLELMDGNRNKEQYRVIIEAVNAVEGASNPHKARMRKISGFWDIDLDIHVDGHRTVAEAHEIAIQVENEVKSRLDNVFDIMIHVEPCGDETEEAYGLSEAEMSSEDSAAGVDAGKNGAGAAEQADGE